MAHTVSFWFEKKNQLEESTKQLFALSFTFAAKKHLNCEWNSCKKLKSCSQLQLLLWKVQAASLNQSLTSLP
jgi:hypothetical protein